MKETIFRKYDIRGVVNRDFTIDDAKIIGSSFCSLIGKRKTVSVGMDVRLSSEKIKKKLINGIRMGNCNVIDVGIVPTPLLYFSVLRDKTDAGVMITASHNPSEYNGFKFRKKGAKPYQYKDILKIKKTIERKRFRKRGEGKVIEKHVVGDYINYIKNKFNFQKKLKVVVDAGNGTCGEIFPKILEELGCEVTKLFCKPDGKFPNHIPDPSMDETLVDLQKKVVETNSDLGIAFDNDGDRVGFIDERGNIVRSDVAMILLVKDILKIQKRPKIVHEVKFSRVFIEFVKNNGGIPLMSKVGYPNIVRTMMKKKSLIGGELSGHFYFAENNYYEDGIFAGLKLIEYLSRQKTKFSEIIAPFLKYISTEEERIPCPDERKYMVVKRIRKSLKSQGYEMKTIDGVRIEFKDGWGLLRPSNTEPELSLRFEAKTKEKLEEIRKIILKELSKQIQ
jgi:phosphomannomutase/phosphoglucomutase